MLTQWTGHPPRPAVLSEVSSPPVFWLAGGLGTGSGCTMLAPPRTFWGWATTVQVHGSSSPSLWWKLGLTWGAGRPLRSLVAERPAPTPSRV